MEETLKQWHRFVATQDPLILDDIVDPNADFHSPVFWKPKHGRAVVIAILTAASQIFEEFKYVREAVDGVNAFLEFEAKVGDLTVRGIDIIKIGDDGKIVDFEVMIRPANGLQAVGAAMTKRLASLTIEH